MIWRMKLHHSFSSVARSCLRDALGLNAVSGRFELITMARESANKEAYRINLTLGIDDAEIPRFTSGCLDARVDGLACDVTSVEEDWTPWGFEMPSPRAAVRSGA